jgi:hypothetical protein
MAKPTILHEADMRTDRCRTRAESTTVIAVGDFLYASGGYAYVLDKETLDANFLGLAYEASASGDTASITVLLRGVIDCSVASSTYNVGDTLGYAGQYSLEANSTQVLAWALERGTATTRIRVLFDTVALGKLFDKT